MEHILLREHEGKNVGVMTLQRESEEVVAREGTDKISYYFYRTLDNRATKEVL